MATNADDKADNDSKDVTAQDLHDLKYGTDGVETDKEDETVTTGEETDEDSAETGEEDGQTGDQATDESEEDTSDEDKSAFVKEFPHIKGDTPEEYAKNLELAYKNSTTEALRLKGIADGKTEDKGEDQSAKVDISDTTALFIKQKIDEEITEAWTDFQKVYPQAVPGTPEYAQFVTEVATLSETIRNSQKRLASPKELYSKAAVILGWEPSGKVDEKEKLGMAMKGSAGTSKTTSSTKTPVKSKVSDQQIAANMLMYPNKTRAQIIEELEPYVK